MIGDTFEPLKTWHDKETKRVGRSLARHIEKVMRVAKDTSFEQALKKQVGELLESEGEFAEKIAQTSRSHTYKVAELIPLWRSHQIALTMGVELVNDTFGPLMQQDPYYHISTVLKERVFIHLFASELHQSDKQDIIFWMKQGERLYTENCRNQPITGNLSALDYSELGSPVPHHA